MKVNTLVYVVFSQHWIRLEMLPDILLHRLYMKVEPSDSSYMPSLVVISAGDTLSSMKEIRAVNITSSESVVTLLQDLNDVSGSDLDHSRGILREKGERYKIHYTFHLIEQSVLNQNGQMLRL